MFKFQIDFWYSEKQGQMLAYSVFNGVWYNTSQDTMGM